jgi:DNA segregation ATPase FtsK/SpoIIIE, S-DNA-T family
MESVALMEILIMVLGLMAAGGIFIAARYRSLLLEVRELRHELATIAPARATEPEAQPTSIPADTLPGAGVALASPPADYRLVTKALSAKGPGKFRIPLGWYAGAYGPHLHTAQLQDDVNHTLITGQSDSGKDNLALGMMLALANTHTPNRVQFAIVDGKGLDWIGWEKKAHTWLLATDPEHISGAMAALVKERKRRREILANAGVSKWDYYQGDDLPLLVVFVSELLLLENATSKSELTSWLNTELTAARAFGIRYLLATQTASNFSTQWRSQISLFLAGYQPSASQDAPNVGITTSEIEQAGAVAPSKLPAPGAGAAGVFCAVQGAAAVNVRTSYINDKQRDYLLAQLPNKTLQPKAPPVSRPAAPAHEMEILQQLLQTGQPLPLAPEPVEQSYRATEIDKSTFVEQSEPRRTFQDSPSTGKSVTSYVELPLPDDLVPFDEQRKIIEAAPTVKSKRQLALKLYSTDGGQKSTWVKLVCDAVGLLQPQA